MPKEKEATTSTSGTEVSEEQLQSDMGRIDAARATQDKTNPLDQVISGEAQAAATAVAPAEPDPMMVSTFKMLVTTGITVLHEKYKWTDPGDEWKTQVATLSALLVDRYMPDLMKDQGEIAALTICLGVYVLENVVRQTSGSGSDSGAKGERKDDFIKPPVEDGITRLPHPA